MKGQELKQRVETIADALYRQLPEDFSEAVSILENILGPENKKETGMFTEGYWLMPVAYYVEKSGLKHFKESVQFIEKITKRHTGEYAIRPFLAAYPQKTLRIMNRLSKSMKIRMFVDWPVKDYGPDCRGRRRSAFFQMILLLSFVFWRISSQIRLPLSENQSRII